MSIRNETFNTDGSSATAEVIDLDARTVTIEVDGQVQSARPLTDDEVAQIVLASTPAPSTADVVAARLAAQSAANPQPWHPPTHAGDAYLAGEVVTVDGKRWRNDHTGPNPWPVEARYFWTLLDVPAPSEEWAPGVTYVANDEVTYLGVRYRIVTPHTSQVGWEPPAVPALWTPVA